MSSGAQSLPRASNYASISCSNALNRKGEMSCDSLGTTGPVHGQENVPQAEISPDMPCSRDSKEKMLILEVMLKEPSTVGSENTITLHLLCAVRVTGLLAGTIHALWIHLWTRQHQDHRSRWASRYQDSPCKS